MDGKMLNILRGVTGSCWALLRPSLFMLYRSDILISANVFVRFVP